MSLKQMMHTAVEEIAYLPQPDVALTVRELEEVEINEAPAFLAERPIHTVIMMGLIPDNGLVSEVRISNYDTIFLKKEDFDIVN